MNLLEYEAKELLATHGAPVPQSQLVREATAVCPLPFPAVVKVQIPVGGRGKAGGIRKVASAQEYALAVQQLLGASVKGYEVQSLLIEACLTVQHEYYVAILLDREAQSLVLLVQREGGIEVESASPGLRIPLTAMPTTQIAKEVQEYLGLPSALAPKLQQLLESLWEVCDKEDALLVEINPLILTSDQQLYCADAKIIVDAAAAFRHPTWHFEQSHASSQFVVLNTDGQIASMANGAGLAMATVDAIVDAGATPANFFDVGGGTGVAAMVAACHKMTALPHVRAIVVNIFAGITRCDQVAEALIAATHQIPQLPPLYIRLSGTNEQAGRQMLQEAKIPILPTLGDCVAAAVKSGVHV